MTLPLIGQPTPRIDAVLKVTGQARYAADQPAPGCAHARLVTSPMARGRITAIDAAPALAVPGTLLVLTHENAPAIPPIKFVGGGGQAADSRPPLQSAEIAYAGQIVALVVAETVEAADEAARRLVVEYAPAPVNATLDAPGVEVETAKELSEHFEETAVGSAAQAWDMAAVRIEATYETPPNHHNPIELFSTTASWEGHRLTLHEPSQWVYGLKVGVATQLGIDPDDVLVVCPFVGGAFGGKATVTSRSVLAALAARRLGRPVKLVVSRAQGFTIGTFRAETKHRVRLACDAQGKLTAYDHEAWELTSRADAFIVNGVTATARMYGFPNVATKVWGVRADRSTPGFMRAPAEVPYMFALESAVDELAWQAGIDSLRFRLMNDTATDPISGKPFTSRGLAACYERAAVIFGWERRSAGVGGMVEGDDLVGFGCATACYPTQISPAAVRLTLTAAGRARLETAAHDVGTGAYTALGQIAAGLLGIDPGRVDVVLGRSDLPVGPVAGGSVTTASVGSAVALAAAAITRRLAQAAVMAGDGPLAGANVDEVRLEAGRLTMGPTAGEDLSAAFARLGTSSVQEYAEWSPASVGPDGPALMYKGAIRIVGGPLADRTQFSFGAELVEVRIDRRLKTIRVPRAVGVFASGRIINARTAHSQLLGGMVWGVSSALHEASEVDPRNGRYVNDNLAEYLVPVNADIRDVHIEMLEEDDTLVNPVGVKGLGELGGVGTNAAVANAVFHATGHRVRHLPIRMDDLLQGA